MANPAQPDPENRERRRDSGTRAAGKKETSSVSASGASSSSKEDGTGLDAGPEPGREKVSGFDLSILADPAVFKVNCLPAHSDHMFFADERELEKGAGEPAGTAGSSVLRYSLNGLWKFSYSEKPADAPAGFEALSYDCRTWADIRVPAHIQMEGYDVPAYINYQYPWDSDGRV